MASGHICVQDFKRTLPRLFGWISQIYSEKKGKLGAISLFPLILEAPTGESLSPSLQLPFWNLSLTHIFLTKQDT